MNNDLTTAPESWKQPAVTRLLDEIRPELDRLAELLDGHDDLVTIRDLRDIDDERSAGFHATERRALERFFRLAIPTDTDTETEEV